MTKKRTLQVDENIVSAVSAFINHGLDPGTCARLLLQGRYDEAYLNAHPLIKPHWEDHVAFIEGLPEECRGENYGKWAAAKLLEYWHPRCTGELQELNTPEPKDKLIARLMAEAEKVDPDLPSVASALEFRREQYGLRASEFAMILGISKSCYSMVVHGERELPRTAMRRAYAVGVPAAVLLQAGGESS